MNTTNTKKCLYCQGEIHIDAVKCRHCKQFLNETKQLEVQGPVPGTYYQPSGEYNLQKILLWSPLSLIVLYLGGLGYNYWCSAIESVYFSFLGIVIMIMAGFGASMILINLGQIRNRLVVNVIAAIIAVLTVYINWMTFVPVRTQAGFAQMFIGPFEILDVLPLWAENANYIVNGQKIPSLLLKVFWLMEAVGLLIGTFILTTISTKSIAYCERCTSWLDEEYKSPVLGEITDLDEFKPAIESLDFSAISNLGLGDKKASHTEVTINKCLDCKKAITLNITSTVINVVGLEKKEKEKTIINNLWISSDHLAEIKKIISDLKAPSESLEEQA